jgi:hypothetical protein
MLAKSPEKGETKPKEALSLEGEVLRTSNAS